jgi:hypothetical protein
MGQGQTKPRLYGVFDTLEQTGRDIGGHLVAVRLRSERALLLEPLETRTPSRILPDSVTVACLTLDQLVNVRIQVRQLPKSPYLRHFPVSYFLLNLYKLPPTLSALW